MWGVRWPDVRVSGYVCEFDDDARRIIVRSEMANARRGQQSLHTRTPWQQWPRTRHCGKVKGMRV